MSRKHYYAMRRAYFKSRGLNSCGKEYVKKKPPGWKHPELSKYKYGTKQYKAAYMRMWRNKK